MVDTIANITGWAPPCRVSEVKVVTMSRTCTGPTNNHGANGDMHMNQMGSQEPTIVCIEFVCIQTEQTKEEQETRLGHES